MIVIIAITILGKHTVIYINVVEYIKTLKKTGMMFNDVNHVLYRY